ncbi:hypothetical protein AALP_AAs67262U000100 [Arabis alpina]|uniref:Arabidopsis retrotransposon Orf1 C-terminal domain-containing protein n=1 Tax=Arabis alpina TaxID=50452 RepID=A0A087FX67_ARAAL|nr:hypothetical protein AALP_AAs67262U000100 [Arabis alpina]
MGSPLENVSNEKYKRLTKGIRTVWTHDEREFFETLKNHGVPTTRYANRRLLDKMRMLEAFDEAMVDMGMEIFSTMEEHTYITPTYEFLATWVGKFNRRFKKTQGKDYVSDEDTPTPPDETDPSMLAIVRHSFHDDTRRDHGGDGGASSSAARHSMSSIPTRR